MSLSSKLKNSIKAALRTYARYQAQSKAVQFNEGQSDDLIFATGFDKSGTTWLMNILDLHPEIVCRGSGQIFNYYVEGMHFLADRGGYGNFVEENLDSRWFEKGGRVWFDESLVRANFANLVSASFRRFGNDSTKYYGDKSTVQDVKLIRELFPDSKVIAMMRDGRDVAVSFAYHFRRGGKGDKFNNDGTFSEDYLIKVARAWTAYSKHIRENLNDAKLKVIKYVDLLTNTKKEIETVYEFVNVNANPELVSKVMDETKFENLSGGRPPGSEDADSYFRKGIAGDWVNHFNDQEKSILRDIISDELIYWGYEDNDRW